MFDSLFRVPLAMSSLILLTSLLVLFSEKIIDISMKDQKRLMLEARATRREIGHIAVKSDLSDLETKLLKKRKVALSKVISTV